MNKKRERSQQLLIINEELATARRLRKQGFGDDQLAHKINEYIAQLVSIKNELEGE